MNYIEGRIMSITAEEYLAGSPFYPVRQTLDADPGEPVSSKKRQAIQDALFFKGGKPRDRYLALGEYERMINILSSEYPEAFEDWLRTSAKHLREFQIQGRLKAQLKKEDENTFPRELRPFFEKEENRDILDLIEWV